MAIVAMVTQFTGAITRNARGRTLMVAGKFRKNSPSPNNSIRESERSAILRA